MCNTRRIVLLIAALSAVVPSFAQTASVCDAIAGNLVKNCGFELGTVPITGFGSTDTLAPVGWAVNSYFNTSGYANGFDSVVGACTDPSNWFCRPSYVHSGSQALNFGNTSQWPPAQISQVITDTPGQNYVVTFFVQNINNVGNESFVAQINGTNQFALNAGNSPSSYTRFSFSFAGTGSDTLSFLATSDGYGYDLDDMSVVTVSFSGPTTYAVGGGPIGIATADFNRDGILDLLVVSQNNTFSYLQGLGNGTFMPPVSFSSASITSATSCSLTVADFNNDGNLDLAITHCTSQNGPNGFGNQVTVHLGDGAGNFSAPGILFTTGGSDTGIASGDFNGDGNVDLAIGSQDASSVFVYFGNGDGTFTLASQFDTGAPTYGAKADFIAAIDVNKDGHPDLIAANGSDGSVSVFLNNGAGGFGPPTLFSTGAGAGIIVGGDFNHDGNVDLAVSSYGGDSVTILLGNGGGGFVNAGAFPANGAPTGLAAADFNKDGNLDVLSSDDTGGPVTILLGTGNGQLEPGINAATGSVFRGVSVGDFNGDGMPDFAVVDAGAGTVSVFLNETAAAPPPACITPPSGVTSWWPGDGNANDIVGGNNGTLVGGVTFAAGEVGQAFSFDGTTGYVQIPSSVGSQPPSAISIDAWVYPTAYPSTSSGASVIISKYDSANGGGYSWALLMQPTGQVEWYVIGPGQGPSSQLEVVTAGTLSLGAWQHVAATYDTATQAIAVYVDGVQVPTTCVICGTVTSIYQSSANVLIGALISGNPGAVPHNLWSGLIDEAQIFDRALGQSEIQAIYNAGSAGECKPPVVDTTPPNVTPTITGTLGSNGWYISNVNVSWNVNDPESGILSSTGCGPTALTANTAGIGLTCSATNGVGLSNSVSLTIQIDMTPPTVTVTGVTNGANYTLGAVPAAGCNTTDSLSGVAVNASLTVTGGTGNGLGTFTATCSGGTDNAGNTSAPVADSYTVQPPPVCTTPPSGVTSWWPGDGNANDIVGGNNGTLVGGVTFAAGEVGQAFSFDGSTGYVQVPSSSALQPPSAISIDAWVYPTAYPSTSSGASVIISKYDSANGGGYSWALLMQPTGQVEWYVIGNPSSQVEVVTAGVLSLGQWQHIAATFDTATQAIAVYVNGVQVPTTCATGATCGTITSIYQSSANVLIGALISGNPGARPGNLWSGLIDEVQIFDRALGQSEIQAIYNAGSAGECKSSVPVTITFGALSNQVIGTAPFMVSATASSGLPVSFASTTPAVCTVSGTIVTLISVGTCTIQATQGGNSTYAAATPVNQSFQVNKATPTVSFTGAPATAPYQGAFTVAATTNATTTAVITASGSCSIAGVTVTILAPSGTCSLSATWAADSNYLAASATQYTTATTATPTINWPTPAAITYGTALSGTQLDATATYNAAPVTGTFLYTPTKGTVLSAGTQTLSVTFTPKNTTDYGGAGASVILQVNQAKPKINWAKPLAITYGTALSGAQLDATASVPGSFVYSPPAGTVLAAGTQTLSVTFTPTDTTDYATATDTVTITVDRAAPTLTWATPLPITYGTPLSSAQLDATASVAGSFVYSPASGAIEVGGSDKLSVTFTPTDALDYTTATESVMLQVNPATPTINWPTPAAITYGTALSGTQLDATATYNGVSVAGTFVYTPTKGTVLSAGTQTLSVAFTPNNTANYAAPPSASVILQVNQAKPKITWAKPAAITYGTALSGTQLDATASVPGSFVYSPPAGTVLAAGTQTLSVTFTPTDTTDYATATDTVTIAVK